MLSQHGINYHNAMDRFGGNEALFVRLAGKFLDDSHFLALEEALTAGDIEEAHRQAHSLKGVAGNLSFDELFQQSSLMLDALRSDNLALAQEHLPAARSAYDNVMKALTLIA